MLLNLAAYISSYCPSCIVKGSSRLASALPAGLTKCLRKAMENCPCLRHAICVSAFIMFSGLPGSKCIQQLLTTSPHVPVFSKHRNQQGKLPTLQHAQICKLCPLCQLLAAMSMSLSLHPAFCFICQNNANMLQVSIC